ncbi:MAG TPA: metallophosphoesterase [Bryobacteraceae bacterium]|nr:metallophosphoesterase [Bryobacteraceae bacterium]
MTLRAERKSTTVALPFPRPDAYSLAEALEPRLAVERHFASIGHTYRHGRLYRKFEHRITRPLLKSALCLAGLYSRGIRNAVSPVVRHLFIAFEDLPAKLEGFTLLHLSDFHIDGVPGLADALSPLLSDLRPDLCVLTGDYRFEDQGACEPVYPLMRQLIGSIQARHGIYGILGNHDDSEIAHELEEMGVRMLVNEAVEIQANSASFWLAGVDDPFDFRCHDLTRALAQVPPDAFQILLAHAPEIYEQAAQSGVDLYLSGHTHAGQIRLPWVGAVRHNAHCPREYAYGLWRHGGMRGYTSAGIGCSSLPIRFGCPPEAVMIELRRSSYGRGSETLFNRARE